MYVEHEEVKKRKWSDTERFLDVHQIKFTGFRCPRPLFKFEHANFPEFIIENLKTLEKPTALQCMSWPILLSGRDLIAVSNSGYGKHLAYMLPLIVHIKNMLSCDEYKSPCALILTPYQPGKEDIYAATKKFLDAAEIRCLTIYDGEEKEQQIELLKTSKFDLLIANPIRLNDLMEEARENGQDFISLANVSFVVVDEYIQFRKSQTMEFVKKCVERTKKFHQTAVFSRLVPSGIQRQGDEFVRNCIFFEMHHDKESANDEIKQIVELCDKDLKASRLVELVDSLTRNNDCKILIYAKDKEKCLNLNFEVKRQLDLDVLDFRKEEHLFVSTPNAIMTTFKNIGLEISIPDLQYIINVDFPPNLQTYIDRLRKGVVHYTLFSRQDAKHAERLVYSLKQARQEYDQNLTTMVKAWLECGRDKRFMASMQDIQKGISKPQREIIFSSDDEELLPTLNTTSKSTEFSYGSMTSRYFSSSRQMNDEEDEEDYDEDEEYIE